MKCVEHVGDLPTDTLRSHAVEIFNAFIHSHLAEPDGSRSVVYISVHHFIVNLCDNILWNLCISTVYVYAFIHIYFQY